MIDYSLINLKLSNHRKNPSSYLDLSNLEIEIIPEEVFNISNVTHLNLSDNHIKVIPSKICNLKKIEILDLSCNDLTELPNEIYKLISLKELYLYGNHLFNLPETIGKLTNLRKLGVRKNQLKVLPESIGDLINIEGIDISDNSLTELPISIAFLPKLKELILKFNPFQVPSIEIISQGLPAIKNYFISLKYSEGIRLNEAKLLIVGEGGVGKTSLMKCLTDDNFLFNHNKINSTEGIDIGRINLGGDDSNSFHLNIWDFGGQEIYHSTHQFFLTRRSLYILVWEARKDFHMTFDYWLNIVNLLSNKSPIILVLNKVDERIREIDEITLAKRFPNIVYFSKVSVKTNQGILDLKDQIKKEIRKLPSVGDILPLKWIEIRNYLQKIDKNYISYDEYIAICKEFDLNKEKANYLSRYFHDLGVFLNFCDNQILKDIIFLKPEWATNAVYNLLDRKEILLNKGQFYFSDLKTIWYNYPFDTHIALLELLNKFELCFKIPDTNKYIIPELLSVSQPQIDVDFSDGFIFEYRYNFMPSGIITRLIARKHDLIYNDYFWRNGVIFKFNSSKMLIISNAYDRKITIRIVGNEIPLLLSIIRHEIQSINKTLNNPEVSIMLPCCCSGCLKDETPYFFEYNNLLIAKEKNNEAMQCQKHFNSVPIHRLLNEEIIKELPSSNKSEMKDFQKLNINGDNIQIINAEKINIKRNTNVTKHKKRRSRFWIIISSIITLLAALATIFGTNLFEIF
ncbi:COR domain-containing protein [Sunxiuqinia sp. A32]|uniref:COR domain-containing protein n=1 Tax=Sunxiuqinia sp. A32 TaxID=3461496 RepID=UPI0040466C6F